MMASSLSAGAVRRVLRVVLGILLLASCAFGAGPDHKPSVVLLEAPEVKGTGIGRISGLLLADRDDFHLIDIGRDGGAAPLPGVAALAAPGAAAKRAQLSQAAGADMLVTLSSDGAEHAPRLCLIVSDGRTGIRLHSELLEMAERSPLEIAEAVRDRVGLARAAFPAGVNAVVALAPLAADRLPADNADLSARLTDLIRLCLLVQPGTAVVDPEDSAAEAVAPVRVSGQVVVFAGGEPEKTAVRLSLTVTRDTAEEKIEIGPVAPGEAGGVIAAKVLPRLVSPPAPDEAVLFDRLVARADQASEIADFGSAMRWREAAILLRPAAVDQRVKLIGDCREAADLAEIRFAPNKAIDLDNPSHARIAQAGADACIERYRQVAALIRMRAVPVDEATRLAQDVVTGHPNIGFIIDTAGDRYRRLGQEQLERVEVAKHAFLLREMPLLRKWIQEAGARGTTRDTWDHTLTEGMIKRWDRTYWAPEDLDFIRKVLVDVAPEDSAPDRAFDSFIQQQASRTYDYYPGVRAITEQDWLEFVSALETSPSPRAQQYGRIARASFRHLEPKSPPPKRTDRPQPPPEPPRRTLGGDELHLPPTDPKTGIGAVVLHLQIRPREGGQPVSAERLCYRSQGGWYPPSGVTPCGPDTDIWWHPGALLVMREKGFLDELLIDPEADIHDVRWDGRFAWVASGRDGVRVIKTDGTEVAHFGSSEGLPPADRGIRVRPLGDGRAIAVGAFGRPERGWCARLEINQRGGSVDVFHEARRYVTLNGTRDAVDRKTPGNALDRDTRIGFLPAWLHYYAAKDGSHRILVGRDSKYRGIGNRPLEIDPATLAVTVFPYELLCPADRANDSTYVSRRGFLFEASSFRGLILYPPEGETFLDSKTVNKVGDPMRLQGNDSAHAIGDWVYTPGSWKRSKDGIWFPIPMGAGGPPLEGMYPMFTYGVSSHYGLVGWGRGGYCQVTGLEGAPDNPPPPRAEPADKSRPRPEYPSIAPLETRPHAPDAITGPPRADAATARRALSAPGPARTPEKAGVFFTPEPFGGDVRLVTFDSPPVPACNDVPMVDGVGFSLVKADALEPTGCAPTGAAAPDSTYAREFPTGNGPGFLNEINFKAMDTDLLVRFPAPIVRASAEIRSGQSLNDMSDLVFELYRGEKPVAKFTVKVRGQNDFYFYGVESPEPFDRWVIRQHKDKRFDLDNLRYQPVPK